jgi:hypothetical protein
VLHTHYLSSGAGAISQLVADVPSGLGLTPPQETKIRGIYGKGVLESQVLHNVGECRHFVLIETIPPSTLCIVPELSASLRNQLKIVSTV